MLVKVNGHVYDTKEEPIAIVLSDKDKENIAAMDKNCAIFYCAPDKYSDDDAYNFIHDPRLVVKDG